MQQRQFYGTKYGQVSVCRVDVCVSYLGAGQPAHDKVLVLQAIILFLIIAGSFSSAGRLETSKGRPAGLRVEGVHYDGLGAFNLTAAKWAALTL